MRRVDFLFPFMFSLVGIACEATTSHEPPPQVPQRPHMIGDSPSSSPTPTQKSILEIVMSEESLATLAKLIKASGLSEQLTGPNEWTLFAPNEEAFASLTEKNSIAIDDLLKPENQAKLQDMLKYHLIAERLKAEQVVKMTTVQTLQGKTVSMSVSGTLAKVNDAQLMQVDLEGKNGVVHIIDTVLQPSP
ncbi:fasciclin domain-containing protein [Pajaroellobacter abortibovis]|uniref:FAS1 domain-containing protein n=1 Tax=Pajaroellobacter abortibovis TaxID=1882918 RepID=A0A1L6MYU7_9BACT|nr:fasciclin domain-containing protein [Pajaroellobacter abortibovis]APS00649.1 hypothetical protein BCY86_08165 [Pajaroellobacter abortibovis]